MSGQIFRTIDKYIVGSPIACGGMATVYLARPVSLPRVVAIKQLKPEMARDPAFVRMFLDEAQLLCRIRHKNVAPPIDTFQHAGEFFIVIEYVEGQSLSQLTARARGPIAPPLAIKNMSEVLTGLDAAHDATDASGQPLNLVHRDVSPHNILVGIDGATRVVDFGIAKAAWRAQFTQCGQVRGKPGYMSPEQLTCGAVDRRTDLYAAGIVLWELLVGRRLFREQLLRDRVCTRREAITPPSALTPDLPRDLDHIVSCALSSDPKRRFRVARAMAAALLDVAPVGRDVEVGAWVSHLAREELKRRAELVSELENVRPSEVSSSRRALLAPSGIAPASGAPRVEASPSGYVMGPNEASVAHPSVTLGRGTPKTRRGVFAGVALVVTLGSLGTSYVATSRSSASANRARPSSVDVTSSARGSEPESPSSATLRRDETEPPIAPQASAPVACNRVPEPARPTRRSGATPPAVPPSAVPALPFLDSRALYYNPSFDVCRH
jgi:serine/threonine-protein kinase